MVMASWIRNESVEVNYSMDEIQIVDTTLRDGDISLWAYGMTTGMMLPALRHMDEAGFDSMEFFLSLRFKKFVREHKEDPWDWLRLGTKEIKKTRLRYHGGLHSGFEFIPECIRRLVIQTVAKYGIDLIRTSNACNNFEALGREAKELKKLGMHTAIPPLANGSSQPSIFNVASNLRALGYKPLVNIDALAPVREHFSWIAEREGLPVGAPREYDQAWYSHQVPGGMISNLRHQLKLMGKEEMLAQVLEEISRVRSEMGYPIMVTPFAQFVGSQAAINVILGERYKEVTDQVIQYALGLWGREGSDYMDAAAKTKILDRSRAREIEKIEYPEPTLEEVRRQYGGPHLSDEELLLRYYAGPEFVDALKTAPARKEYLSAPKPLLRLVEELSKKKLGRVYIRKGDFSLTLQRSV